MLYVFNTLYLNSKMGRVSPKRVAEEPFLAFFYVFFLFFCIKIFFYFFISAQNNIIDLFYNKNISSIVAVIGVIFCSVAIVFFIYVTYFEKTFPSCLHIQKGEKLTGIYEYVRHPSYIVFFLITFGTALCFNDAILFILACINHVFVYFFYMLEENDFVKRFPKHKEYISKTRRFFPVFKRAK